MLNDPRSRRQYRQVADQILLLAAQRGLMPGQRMPSERDLAEMLGVSRPSLREALIAHLPAHMVPGRIIRLERMPLTPNRKIDRRQLPVPGAAALPAVVTGPAPAADSTSPAIPSSAPSEELAAAVQALWSEVLGVPQIAPRDNFFALGGHSLLAIQLHRTMRDRLSLPRLGVTDIFRFPVMADFIKHVAGLGTVAAPAPAAGAAPPMPAVAKPAVAEPATAESAPPVEVMGRSVNPVPWPW